MTVYLNAPPIRSPIAYRNGMMTPPWQLWFSQGFKAGLDVPVPPIDGALLSDDSVYDIKINSMVADKLKTGQLIGVEIILNGAASIIRSNDFVAGVSGWQIKGDGTAELADAIIRGTLNAGDLTTGEIPTGRYGADTVPSSAIASLVVNKLVGGTITGQTIILSGTGSLLKSSNYIAGSSGFSIRGDGLAEFQSVTVRGNLDATDLQVGYINSARYGASTIGAQPIVSGALHRQYGQGSTISFPYFTNTTIQTGSYASPATIIPSNPDRTAVAIFMSVGNVSVSANQQGHILTQVARGTAAGLLALSKGIVLFSPWSAGTNQTNGFITTIFYEDSLTTGTGSLAYYFRGHQCIHSSGLAQNLQTNWFIMEFSR